MAEAVAAVILAKFAAPQSAIKQALVSYSTSTRTVAVVAAVKLMYSAVMY